MGREPSSTPCPRADVGSRRGQAAFSGGGGGLGLMAPGQQLIDIALRMSGDDAGDDAGDVGVRIDIVELCGLDQRGEDRPVLGAAV